MGIKKDLLAKINKLIKEEKGTEVEMDDYFRDANLDSLGTMVVLITLDAEYHIFNPDEPGQDMGDIDYDTFTIRDLINKCILANTNTNMEPSKDPDT